MALASKAVDILGATPLVEVPDPIVGWDPTSNVPPIRYAITSILVCNNFTPDPVGTDEGITGFDLYIIKRGEARGTRNQILNSLQLPAGETFTLDSEKIVLESGDKIDILGESPTVLSATVSWMTV
jgi:hypothetical protein